MARLPESSVVVVYSILWFEPFVVEGRACHLSTKSEIVSFGRFSKFYTNGIVSGCDCKDVALLVEDHLVYAHLTVEAVY